MAKINIKYPRTFHLPYSLGATSDDKRLSGNWFDAYAGREIVITEKLDGENTALTRNDCFARSHSVATRSAWTQNLWGSNGLIWKIKDLIGVEESIYGENLYGVHSIYYDRLPCYWFMFAANNGEYWYSWNEIEELSEILGVRTVPVLWKGIVNSEEQLKDLVTKFASQPSAFGKTREGCVVRNSCGFLLDCFCYNVCKFVRANHVQTDEHWTKNWKKATLINNI